MTKIEEFYDLLLIEVKKERGTFPTQTSNLNYEKAYRALDVAIKKITDLIAFKQTFELYKNNPNQLNLFKDGNK